MSSPPKRSGRRAEQRMETERLIRLTALALFTERGFEATTTKQIADAAGVAHGTVFLVAATKEALLVKVLEEQLRAVVARRARLPRHGIKDQLLHVFNGLFDFYARQPQLSRVFLKSIMFFDESIAKAQYDEHVAHFAAYLASLFDAAIARGELAPDTDSQVAASNVLALYLLHTVSFLNDAARNRRALGARFRTGLEALLGGLRAPEPVVPRRRKSAR